jgi:hypothetical protein
MIIIKNFNYIMLFLAILVMNTELSSANVSSSPHIYSAPESKIHFAESDWEGSILDILVKVRLRKQNGVWQGWFVSRKDGSIDPFKKLEVNDKSIHFTLPGNPELDVDLEFNKKDDVMTGIYTFPSGTALPVTFKRL